MFSTVSSRSSKLPEAGKTFADVGRGQEVPGSADPPDPWDHSHHQSGLYRSFLHSFVAAMTAPYTGLFRGPTSTIPFRKYPKCSRQSTLSPPALTRSRGAVSNA